MGLHESMLLALAVLAGALSVWAWRTGSPGEDVNLIQTRPAARHSQAVRGEVTTRLRPAAPEPPPADLADARLARLPRREDMPWNQ